MQQLHELLGFFYPRKCILCRKILSKSDERDICLLCHDRIQNEVIPLELLKTNAQELQEEMESEAVVGEVKNRREILDLPEGIISLFPYEGVYRQAILRWKYRGRRKYAKLFAKLIVEKDIFKGLEEGILVPIPSASSRFKKRGFNQALDLAVEVGKLTGISVVDCIKRSRDTKAQTECTRDERYRNIRGNMYIEKYSKVNAKSIILIDDIYTTGSTIREAVRVIRKQYTFREAVIWVVVIGKGEF